MSTAHRVIPLVPEAAATASGVVEAVLQQLATELSLLARSSTHLQVIDLRSLPLDEAALALLRERLGQGEVRAEVCSAAITEIEETAYPGVWWQRQRHATDDAGGAVWQSLVVAAVPPLLVAHRLDVADAAGRLQTALQRSGAPTGAPANTGAMA